jgi:hypothetical protein
VLDARPGTLLIGDEGAFGEGENYYNGAVVLLVKVCGCNPSIFGVILNRLATHTMAEEFCPRRSLLGHIASPKLHLTLTPSPTPILTLTVRSAAHYPAFTNNTVHLGGPVGPYWSVLSPQVRVRVD